MPSCFAGNSVQGSPTPCAQSPLASVREYFPQNAGRRDFALKNRVSELEPTGARGCDAPTMSSKASVEIARDIGARITLISGHRVLLDADLAALYVVTTKRLNEQVRRNMGRFPVDFAFQLSAEEADSLRSQNATLKTGRGRHRKYRPWAFTEHGAIMAATIGIASPRRPRVGRSSGSDGCALKRAKSNDTFGLNSFGR